MVNFFDLLGRILISILFLSSAYNKIFNVTGSVEWMEGFGVPGFLIYPTIILEVVLPIFIIIGYQTKISASILSVFCLATAFLFHADFSNQMQLIAFFKNIGLAGGFLFLVANGPKGWAVDAKKKYVRL